MDRIREHRGRRLPVHETFRAAALLAVVGGFLDAYTYLLRGGVFANAQTGNMVLLGVHLSQQEYLRAAYCVLPIIAFAAGVLVTEIFKRHFTKKKYLVYEHWLVVIEIIILTIIGLLPLSVPDGVVNVTISFVCSLQVNGFKKLRGLNYASTMCTGNLRSGMEKLTGYILDKEKSAGREAAHYFGVILLFIFGAAFGTVATLILGNKSVWCCSLILFGVFVVMCLDNKRAVPD